MINIKKWLRKKKVAIISILLVLCVMVGVLTYANAASTFTITGNINVAKNAINLSWNVNDSSDTWVYKIHQKKEGSNSWQTISTSNLNKQVKVLNVYPDKDTITDRITYKTYNGTARTLPKSASLEMWMETPNAYDSKGYGKGLIQVDPIGITSFNANPSGYMKNADGSWKYDVIFFGSWDNNAGQDITQSGFELVKQFIQDGRGLLLGHDTIAYDVLSGPRGGSPTVRFLDFLPYMNLEKIPSQYFHTPVSDIPSNYQSWGSDEVTITKKGLLTEWPWNIGDVGTVLNIPYAHTGWIISHGDRWLKFTNIKPISGSNYVKADQYMANENPKMNGYLYSFGNTAMIQTGHSKGSATSDEQKILANTLFYLSQLTTDTSLTDYSGMDIEGPNAPAVVSYNNSTQKVTITTPSDNGTTYSYYAEAEGKRNGSIKTSNIITLTNASGVNGYSFVVDNSTSTTPDKSVDSTSTTFSVNASAGNYLHVVAIDKVGNVSPVTHYRLDKSGPSVIFSPNGNSTYQKSQSSKVTVTDSQSGVNTLQYQWTTSSSLTAPTSGWSTFTNGSTLTTPSGHTGDYYLWVRATDKSSNLTTIRSDVFRLDNSVPSFSVNPPSGDWKPTAYVVTPIYSDGDSGVETMQYAWSTLTSTPVSWNSYTGGMLTQPATGNYYLHYRVVDRAGNEMIGYVGGFRYENTPPTATTSQSISGWTNGTVTLNLSNIADSGGSGYYRTKLPDGSYVTTTSATFTATANGTYSFVIYDNAGNSTMKTFDIRTIDKKTPSADLVQTPTDWTNGNVVLKLSNVKDSGGSGYYRTKLPDGTFVNSTSIDYAVSTNGTYNFIVYDYAGNTITKTQTVSNIDKVKPQGTLSYSTTSPTNQNVIVSIIATDNASGAKSITLPNGTIINGATASYTVSANGTYAFVITDVAGNTKTLTGTIDVIDKTPPTLTVFSSNEKWTNKPIILTAIALDEGGIQKMVLPNGNVVLGSRATFTIKENGTYTFTVYDQVGNLTTKSILVSNVDVEKPRLQIKESSHTTSKINIQMEYGD